MRSPAAEQVLGLLDAPRTSVVVNLLGIEVSDRALYFSKLMGQITGLRASVGRPHWLVLDETHHLSPRAQGLHEAAFPADMAGAIFITTHPKYLSPAALQTVRTLIAVGDTASRVIAEFCRVVGESVPAAEEEPGEDAVLVWDRRAGGSPRRVAVGKARQVHRRHTRKYAEGRLGDDKSFYFRGPDGTLNLRAFNLATFLQLAQGVDDATWLFHLERGDYTRWFREAIKDPELAEEVESLQLRADPHASRAAVAEAIKRRYAAVDVD